MKKIVFTIYMTLLFSLMAIAAPAQQGPVVKKSQVVVKTTRPGISAREAHKLRHQQRRVNRLERRTKSDGVITPREHRAVKRANRNLNRNIRQERRDLNRH